MSKGASLLGWMLGRAQTPGGHSHHSLGKQPQVTTSGTLRKQDNQWVPVVPALIWGSLKQGQEKDIASNRTGVPAWKRWGTLIQL